MPYLATRTAGDVLDFPQAAGGPNAVEADPAFLAKHPETADYIQDLKPSPRSFATEKHFGVNAFEYIKNGKTTFLRYRFVPVAGGNHLSAEELKGESTTDLFDEVLPRLEKGSIEFRLVTQIAAGGDVTNDSTVISPKESQVVEFDGISIGKSLRKKESLGEQQKVIFDSLPRVQGESKQVQVRFCRDSTPSDTSTDTPT